MKILLLQGGNSNEREVSLRSAKAVRSGLTELGHEIVVADPRDGHAGIIALAAKCDLVFPILHGAGGEDGEVQALLERSEKRYFGARVDASEKAFDKVITKELLMAAGLPTPEYAVVTSETIDQCSMVDRPFVLKPIRGGSSIDTVIERHLPDHLPKFRKLFDRHHELLIEELIDGIEITVSILGEHALPVIEIVPPTGEEFNYENKYNGETSELCPPANVSSLIQQEAQHLALETHRLLGVRHISRTDMIVRPSGSLVILEINTMPGLTDQSLFPKSARQAGYSWTELMAEFIRLTSE
jgi:D-alanine-D-alanine ligase